MWKLKKNSSIVTSLCRRVHRFVDDAVEWKFRQRKRGREHKHVRGCLTLRNVFYFYRYVLVYVLRANDTGKNIYSTAWLTFFIDISANISLKDSNLDCHPLRCRSPDGWVTANTDLRTKAYLPPTNLNLQQNLK